MISFAGYLEIMANNVSKIKKFTGISQIRLKDIT